MEKRDNLTPREGDMNRRAFLKLSGLLGIGVASIGLTPAAAEAVKFNGEMFKVSSTRVAMGTLVSMTLIHPSKGESEEGMGRAFDEIGRLAGLLNRFESTTAVAQLNREGYLRDVPPEVAHVVERSLYYHGLSRGKFDITVKPLIDLFKEKFGGESSEPPTEQELKEALALVGSKKIALGNRSLRFQTPGMGITLDGIAKGYIVDKASEILARYKIKNHLINAGGDIRTMGERLDRKPWTVAVQDPLKGKNYPDIIRMNNGAIATSGNYEIYFDQEKVFHHIVDPSTGLSPPLVTSVSVTASTTMEADALSTSAFVMKPSEGKRFIDSLPNTECLIVAKGGMQLKSKGWRRAAI